MTNSQSHNQRVILAIIVLAQFACTSLWFAGNAILPELQTEFHLTTRSLGDLTSTVQFGFITGTLVFAMLTISDRYSPSKVFFVCAIAGAAANFLIVSVSQTWALFLLRGLVGFFLAGIYPVGMKISADYYEKGLGNALGYLVGALVVGTAFPHLIRLFNESLDWRFVIHATSILAVFGGSLIYFLVPDGPFRKQSSRFDLKLCITVFKKKEFRAAAFGYFGHMWELYTLWAFIPFILFQYNEVHKSQIDISLWSFITIAIGGIACVIGGFISKKSGSANTAKGALLISGLCCVASIVVFQLPVYFFLAFLIVWGASVVADSPQFSTLVAQHAPAEARGTALTIVNSIGFAITILSLQVMNLFVDQFNSTAVFATLAIGPFFGLLALRRNKLSDTNPTL
ncbi:MAG: MFS transporter [Cyclobacteriaceae bacterium]